MKTTTSLDKLVPAIRSELARILIERTGVPEPGKKAKIAYSKKAQEISTLVETLDFGCKKEHVWKLMSALSPDPLPPLGASEGKLKVVFGQAIVPLKNTNAHDYAIGEVAISIDKANPKSQLLGKSGGRGNNMGESSGEFRLATAPEIKAVMAEMKMRGILELCAAFGVE